ncbi:MAG: extracellular solute-binding protein [Lachnospiraceae bacterium]|nr:extracellular solute-binding protein [Lachnospiraceae bacterium]
MKRKQMIALGLITAMLAGCLSGCGNSSGGPAKNDSAGNTNTSAADTSFDTSSDAAADTSAADAGGFTYTGEAPVTQEEGASLKILAQTSNYTNVDIASAEIVETVVANSGVAVDWQLVDYNNYADSVGPMLTTGAMDADIILLPDQDANQTYIKSGLFTALDEHFDEMPNFSRWLDANPVIKAEITAEDGHIYYVPGTNVGKDYQPVLMYNQVWLDKAGMEAPETLDEFVELLRYFKENDMNDNGDASDEIPMSIMAEFLPYMFGPAFGLDLVSGFQADADGNVTYAAADSENYRKYLEFLNGLYKEGLLEVEYNSLDRDQVIERMSNDLTGVGFDFSWAMSMMYSNVLPYYDGTKDTAFIGAAPLSGEFEGYYVGRVELGNMFGVTSASSNISLACRFLDYAMSEPCQEMYQWGIEGESYTVDADGNKSYTEQANDNDWLQQLGINPSFVFPAQQSVVSTDALVADWHAECNAWQEQFVIDPWPFIYSTVDESEVINTYMVDIQTYVDENAAAFITGTKTMDEFESYISGLQALNLSEVINVRQNQYKRYLSALQ